MVHLADVLALDVRVGTVVAVERVLGARWPLLALSIDFGDLGRRTAVCEGDGREGADELLGLQVAAVVNVPPRRVAGVEEQALLLRARDTQGEAVLLLPERPLGDGSRLTLADEA